MIYPSIDTLINKVDSKYTLVIAAAKRARMLNEGARRMVDSHSMKDVSIALEEINLGKVGYERLKK
ncbi:MAG: DNA-directed RNA polymerase subunit omega [Dethiobacter sp.]|nr:DNA-directed RNA polymerase subunit omega [Dethiobacter sp.]MBS3897879.1 DNA-directed RNA polymerase subunit omega [Dethiobacter sp.]MBS3983303.1 DNA-directed RNA polymerase subunit omega [Dethiobacter sp.]MCL4463005.1 DNA-directed RNA polymerase subunit omega [Bacillota bacterium]MCL5993376.1 DNA-directed RNA polymerase subunit omega [Bacillota bacterium]